MNPRIFQRVWHWLRGFHYGGRVRRLQGSSTSQWLILLCLQAGLLVVIARYAFDLYVERERPGVYISLAAHLVVWTVLLALFIVVLRDFISWRARVKTGSELPHQKIETD